mgnify:CR=1 FL=1
MSNVINPTGPKQAKRDNMLRPARDRRAHPGSWRRRSSGAQGRQGRRQAGQGRRQDGSPGRAGPHPSTRRGSEKRQLARAELAEHLAGDREDGRRLRRGAEPPRSWLATANAKATEQPSTRSARPMRPARASRPGTGPPPPPRRSLRRHSGPWPRSTGCSPTPSCGLARRRRRRAPRRIRPRPIVALVPKPTQAVIDTATRDIQALHDRLTT